MGRFQQSQKVKISVYFILFFFMMIDESLEMGSSSEERNWDEIEIGVWNCCDS